MEQRRIFLFITLSMAVLLAWSNIVAPKLFPPPPKNQAAQQADDNANADEDQAADATEGQDEPVEQVAAADQPDNPPAEAQANDQGDPDSALPDHPREKIILGSLDEDSGFFSQITLTTQGASVTEIALNDPRYKELDNRNEPLKVVGNNLNPDLKTLATSVDVVDEQLAVLGSSLIDINWEVVPDSHTPEGVAFRLISPDKRLELTKTYTLAKIDPAAGDADRLREIDPTPYELQLQLSIRNLDNNAIALSYTLQGPVGLPLENEDHTSKYRDVRTGFLEQDGAVISSNKTAADVLDEVKEGIAPDWSKPVRYIGVDVQYFAALLVPQGDQLQSSLVETSRPILVDEMPEPERSDISVQVTSPQIELAGESTVTHDYVLYAGPKREELLTPIGADAIVDFGWFAAVSRGMLWLLNMFHGWGIPYGIAIIMLTVMVRGCMYPISKKQAVGAKKMKELQPEIAELRKKYGNDKEKMAKAQMELFSKHNYNPLAGCLPLFLQLPIFIGLYRALSSSVDLRMAPFLWIDNLAAPDALFRMPWPLPFLGQDFNLLPLVTVCLFIAQQKLFTPPPTDEQQALQYKMMNYMTIFFGFLFYHVPAGLCVYFIASSLWGIAERKLLDWRKEKPQPEPSADSQKKVGGTTAGPKNDTPARKGFWSKLAERMEQAAKRMEESGQVQSTRDRNKRKKSKSRK